MIMKPIHSKNSELETMVFPNAITLKFILSGKDTNGSHSVFEDVVEPNVGPPRHIHHDQDETFFFLEGEFDVELEGIIYHMKPGDVAFIPRGIVHAFKNVGSKPGRLRYVFSPVLNIEEMFREFYAALETGEFNEDRMTEIARNYGQEIVGPPL